MSRRFPLLTAFILLSVAAGGSALFVAQETPLVARGGGLDANDASSGGDAGDAPHLALLLAEERRLWSGNLTPTGVDADWYRLESGGAFCAIASARVSFAGYMTLTASPDRSVAVTHAASPHSGPTIALAAGAGAAPIFGVEPASLRMSTSDTGPQSPGRYSFSLVARSHAQLDPERDGEQPEAGGTVATSAALPKGCLAGRVDRDGDLTDAFHFDVASPRELSISFAVADGGPVDARVVRPDGSVYGAIPEGGVLFVATDQAGRWTVVVDAGAPAASPLALPTLLRSAGTSLSGTDYLLGVSESAEPQPCRPSCAG